MPQAITTASEAKVTTGQRLLIAHPRPATQGQGRYQADDDEWEASSSPPPPGSLSRVP